MVEEKSPYCYSAVARGSVFYRLIILLVSVDLIVEKNQVILEL